jgi:hypothetical protein
LARSKAFLQPRVPALHKEIGAAYLIVAFFLRRISILSTFDGCADPKEVAGLAVVGYESGLFAPTEAIADKHIGGAGEVALTMGARHHCIGIDSHIRTQIPTSRLDTCCVKLWGAWKPLWA